MCGRVEKEVGGCECIVVGKPMACEERRGGRQLDTPPTIIEMYPHARAHARVDVRAHLHTPHAHKNVTYVHTATCRHTEMQHTCTRPREPTSHVHTGTEWVDKCVGVERKQGSQKVATDEKSELTDQCPTPMLSAYSI
ncbi:hypothetical protein LOAG_06023 [Loa loa]|uniref:Uncharacterized protein n=1 Tax=Loa loa TaxID=7209 RepID=A0A1S0TZJ5_LOALO|nr:hypothetical protein LOAG_06023 [Loa loa]EFO22462.1 hypothetical protein LOAG_06023 [Loa loa]